MNARAPTNCRGCVLQVLDRLRAPASTADIARLAGYTTRACSLVLRSDPDVVQVRDRGHYVHRNHLRAYVNRALAIENELHQGRREALLALGRR